MFFFFFLKLDHQTQHENTAFSPMFFLMAIDHFLSITLEISLLATLTN